MDEIKRIDRTLITKGRVIDYYQDTMQMPDGSTVKWDLIDHDGAAAVVAVREDGKLLMVRQYRNPLERETLEIPAGKLNTRDEDPKVAAERELAEETGYICDNIEYLTTIYTTVAFCNEKIGLYLAKGLKDRHPQHLDEDEYIDLEAYTLDEVRQMIYEGKIQDSKTIVGILLYASKYHL
ncbi:MAG: NUDIX hydrolase [Lachnospiraceae bacterium]|nr:NUDIX hydrolase [Lachnospiraceae bacterium]